MFSNTKYILITTVIAILGLFILIALSLFILNQNNLKFNQMVSLVPELSVNKTPEEINRDLFNQGKFQELNTELDNQLAVNPRDISLLLQKAQALAQEASLTFKEKELGDQALKYINQVLGLDPKNIEALTLKGYVFEVQQDYVNAHKYYDQALALDPKNATTLAQKAHAYYLQGDILNSEKYYGMSYKINNNSITSILGLAKIYVSLGKLKEARDMYLIAIDITENNRQMAEIYYSIAVISEKFEPKDLTSYEMYIDKAIELDPTLPLPYVEKSKIYIRKSFGAKNEEDKKNNIEKSFEMLETAISINPNQSLAHIQLAVNFYSVGQVDDAKMILNNLTEIIGNDITLSLIEKENVTKLAKDLLFKIK